MAVVQSFSRAVSYSLRGVMQVVIILSHLYLAADLPLLGFANRLGTTVVALYFFISAYGLMVGAMRADAVASLKGLPRRLWGLIMPFVYATLLYCVSMRWVHGSWPDLSWPALLPNGWFVLVLVWLYIAFYLSIYLSIYLSGHLFSSWHRLSFVLILMACLLQMWVTYSLGYERAWWMTTLGFASGALYAIYEGRWWSWLRRYWVMGLGALVIIGIMALGVVELLPLAYLFIPLLSVAVLNRFGYTAWIDNVSTLPAPYRRVSLAVQGVLRLLSEISYELYLVHGILILVMRHLPIYTTAPYLYALVVLGCSIVVAWLSHRILSPLRSA